MGLARAFANYTPDEFQKKIDDYFLQKKDEGVPYTMAGLAVALDTDRSTLIRNERYEENEKFPNQKEICHSLKKAKAMVEAQIEERSMSTQYAAGCIFNLKSNFGHKDSQDLNIGGQKENPLKIVSFKDYMDD